MLGANQIALFFASFSADSASAQSVRVSQCCGHTKIVQKGTGFGYVAPVQSYGAIPAFGMVPMQSSGAIQSFGFAPTYGAVPVPYGTQFGSSLSGAQYGNPLGVLAAQYGIEFVAELISQLKGSSQNGASAPNGNANEKLLIIPPRKNPVVTPGSADLSAIDQKLNALLTLQALNTATSAKILETVTSTDKKLDQALKLLNDIKPKEDKNK